MADKSPETGPAAVLPAAPETSVGAVDGAIAPFIFTDNAAALGYYNGIAHITLTAMRFRPRNDDKPGTVADNVVTAHLRMNLVALASLKAAIEKIEFLAKPAATASRL
ncbi:MAG: hypothetical protein AB7F22_31660 [Reyranella sp.]|uniref:hypothetical protein n=1 Tax=Reyranella sp. TaxID=1929291 RepID=UPI003D09BE5E